MRSIIGRRFGKLTVIDRCMDTGTKPKVMCKCDCGRIVAVYTTNLYSGKTKSCGCSKAHHRESQTPLYRRYSWIRHTGSEFESYDDFKAWLKENDVGENDKFSVMRSDTEKPFSRENCYIVFKYKYE